MRWRVDHRVDSLVRAANSVLERSSKTLRNLHDITSSEEPDPSKKGKELLLLGLEYFGLNHGAMFRYEQGVPEIIQELPVKSDGEPCSISKHLQWLMPIISERPFWYYVPNRVKHPVWRRQLAETEVASLIAATFHVNGDLGGGFILCGLKPSVEELSEVDIDILLLIAQWMGSDAERYLNSLF